MRTRRCSMPWLVGGVGVVITLAACGGGGDGNSGPTPSISVTASPAALTVEQGQTGTVDVTLTRVGGFSGEVTFSVEGLPTGVGASASPTSLTGGATTTRVTVTVPASTAPGTSTVTVRARATGVGEATATYQLTITATPTYTLSASPTAVTIAQGLTGTTSIGIARTNFTGAVALTLEAPAGITGSFNPASATANTSELTITVAGTVATGDYTLTVRGTATGPGAKSTTVTLTVTPQPNFTLAIAPTALTINAGASDNATVTITRTNFTGAVTLALASPPTGISATFNPTAPTGNSSQMTLSVGAGVAAGNYAITVRGSAPGVPSPEGAAATALLADRDVVLNLTVNPAPDFSLAANPNSLQITQGTTGTTTVTINRTNHAASVALTVAAPTGIGGVFTPASTTGATSSLAITVAGNVAPGPYTLTISGQSPLGTRTTTLNVTVVAAPAGTDVTWKFCGSGPVPEWFAVRDGSGNYTAVQPTSAGGVTSYTFTITAAFANVAFAYQTPSPRQSSLDVPFRMTGAWTGMREALEARSLPPWSRLQAASTQAGYATFLVRFTTTEAVALGNASNCSTPPATTVQPRTGIGFNVLDKMYIAHRWVTTEHTFASPSVNANVTTGAGDVLATRNSVATGVPFFGGIQRNISSATSLNIDGSALPALLRFPLTLPAFPANSSLTDEMYLSTSLGAVGYVPLGLPTTSNNRELIRTTTSQPGDLWGYRYTLTSLVAGGDVQVRGAEHFLGMNFGATSLPLTPTVPVPQFTQVTQSPLRIRAVGSIPVEYSGNDLTISYVSGTGNAFTILSSAARLTADNMTTSYDLRMEDFGASGYPAAAHLNLPFPQPTVMMRGANFTGTPVVGSIRRFATLIYEP